MTGTSSQLQFVLWIQNAFANSESLMIGVSQLGHPLSYLLISAILFWSINSKLGLRFTLLVLFASSLNELLKRAFHLPRPYWVDSRVLSLGDPSGAFGFPSGHAQTSTSWLLIAQSISRRWVWGLILLLIFAIGLSRIALGAHFLYQVATGWIVGGVTVYLFLKFEDRCIAWLLSKSLSRQLLLVSVVPAFLLVTGGLSILAFNAWQVPESWSINAYSYLEEGEAFGPFEFEAVVTAAAALLGLAIGSVLLNQRGGYRSDGSVFKRIIRIPIGLVCVAIILVAMSIFGDMLQIPEAQVAQAWLWQFLTFFLLLFSIFFFIPLLFRRLGICEIE